MISNLIFAPTNSQVEATWRTAEDWDLKQIDAIWPPLLQNTEEVDAAWLWTKKMDGHLVFPENNVEKTVLLSGEMVQGCLITSLPEAPLKLSKFTHPTVYIEYLATAPWNRNILKHQVFKAVGPALVRLAVQRSVNSGRGGRLSLHSANEKSSSFYSNQIKLADRGKDPDADDLPYFEGDESWANQFLSWRKK